ncbi:MAG TPA: helix-turn-helix domain-containing protein, partial [Agromyces sp.]|nr:helix-turn-helix domain-containing protein [Agromyces sp.]
MTVAQSRAAAGPGPDHPRRANLSLILSLVHRQGTLSRAALTRTTGLNRSTVASLIARLAELGL